MTPFGEPTGEKPIVTNNEDGTPDLPGYRTSYGRDPKSKGTDAKGLGWGNTAPEKFTPTPLPANDRWSDH